MKYIGYLGAEAKENIGILIATCRARGIDNKYSIAAVLAVASKESGFIPQFEKSYKNTSNERLRKIFPLKLKDKTNRGLEDLKRNDEHFFNEIYGGLYGNGPTDGYKYRGGGFNQLTFKDNYKKYAELTGIDLINFPEKINEPEVAAKVLVEYFKRRFTMSKDIVKARYKSNGINDFKDLHTATDAFYNANAGFGKDTRNSSNDGYILAHKRMQELYDFIT